MCSGSEAGSHLRIIDFVYHSTLGLRVINQNKKVRVLDPVGRDAEVFEVAAFRVQGAGFRVQGLGLGLRLKDLLGLVTRVKKKMQGEGFGPGGR